MDVSDECCPEQIAAGDIDVLTFILPYFSSEIGMNESIESNNKTRHTNARGKKILTHRAVSWRATPARRVISLRPCYSSIARDISCYSPQRQSRIMVVMGGVDFECHLLTYVELVVLVRS